MEDTGAPNEDPTNPTAAPEVSSSGFPPARTDGARSYVRDPVDSYYASCTAADVQACHIVHELTKWNAVLFPARFELQELVGARGRLSVSSFSNSGLDLPDPSESESSQGERALHRLLTTHHCIVSFHATPPRSDSSETLLCDGLRRNMSLKTLKLQLSGGAISNDLAAAIQCLASLEEIECIAMDTEFHANVFAALCALLRTSSSLISLRMYGLSLAEPESKAMLAALMANSALREFSMGGSLALDSHEETFTNYLRFNTALITLRIAARNEETQHSLLRGVLQNRTLSSLTLTEFICNKESTRLVGRIFQENEVLLAFGIISTHDRMTPDYHRNYDWVAALSANNTLEELALPFSIWTPAIWASFFRVLSRNSSMKKVYINDCGTCFILSSLCGALKESGVEERVSCGNCLIFSNVDVMKCKALSGIDLFISATENVRLEAIRQLPQCPHLNHLVMDVSRGNLTISSALADYVKSTPHLRKLQLCVGRAADIPENLPNEWWTVIMNSICTNASLKELIVWTNSMDKENFQELADSVRHSQSIRTFFLVNRTAANSSAFVTRLSTGIPGNYTLRSVRLDGRLDAEATRSWLAIADTTRRNSRILAQAAQFTEGLRLDRYVAGALERVSLHVALVEDLADLCHATKEATAASVRNHLRSIESMDAFMRFTGVVRERVVCHPRGDGLMQLDQLDEDCWKHIRRYLMVEDIRISAVQIAET